MWTEVAKGPEGADVDRDDRRSGGGDDVDRGGRRAGGGGAMYTEMAKGPERGPMWTEMAEGPGGGGDVDRGGRRAGGGGGNVHRGGRRAGAGAMCTEVAEGPGGDGAKVDQCGRCGLLDYITSNMRSQHRNMISRELVLRKQHHEEQIQHIECRDVITRTRHRTDNTAKKMKAD